MIIYLLLFIAVGCSAEGQRQFRSRGTQGFRIPYEAPRGFQHPHELQRGFQPDTQRYQVESPQPRYQQEAQSHQQYNQHPQLGQGNQFGQSLHKFSQSQQLFSQPQQQFSQIQRQVSPSRPLPLNQPSHEPSQVSPPQHEVSQPSPTKHEPALLSLNLHEPRPSPTQHYGGDTSPQSAALSVVSPGTRPHQPYSRQDVPFKYTTPIPIIRLDKQQSIDGSYKSSYETGNNIVAEETGYLKAGQGSQEQEESLVQQGSYSYTDPDGNLVSVKYTADEGGFRPEGAHLPTPPPVPPEIQRGLDIIFEQIRIDAERALQDKKFDVQPNGLDGKYLGERDGRFQDRQDAYQARQDAYQARRDTYQSRQVGFQSRRDLHKPSFRQ